MKTEAWVRRARFARAMRVNPLHLVLALLDDTRYINTMSYCS